MKAQGPGPFPQFPEMNAEPESAHSGCKRLRVSFLLDMPEEAELSFHDWVDRADALLDGPSPIQFRGHVLN